MAMRTTPRHRRPRLRRLVPGLLLGPFCLLATYATSNAQNAPLIDSPTKAAAAQAAWAKKLGKPAQFTNSVGMKFQLIPPGTFTMGCGDADAPYHAVQLTKPFYMGTHEVTRRQWEAVTGTQRSTFFPGPDMPINFISWYEASDFLGDLNKKETPAPADPKDTKKPPAPGYRLPSEAEWEYAARAGTSGDYYTGATESDLAKAAWYVANSDDATHPVGQKTANAFGLHDMLGNVWEWCEDFYDHDYYKVSPAADPTGPELTLYRYRALRGGSIYYTAKAARTGNRAFYQDSRTERNIGFRVVLPVSP